MQSSSHLCLRNPINYITPKTLMNIDLGAFEDMESPAMVSRYVPDVIRLGLILTMCCDMLDIVQPLSESFMYKQQNVCVCVFPTTQPKYSKLLSVRNDGVKCYLISKVSSASKRGAPKSKQRLYEFQQPVISSKRIVLIALSTTLFWSQVSTRTDP